MVSRVTPTTPRRMLSVPLSSSAQPAKRVTPPPRCRGLYSWRRTPLDVCATSGPCRAVWSYPSQASVPQPPRDPLRVTQRAVRDEAHVGARLQALLDDLVHDVLAGVEVVARGRHQMVAAVVTHGDPV